MDRLDAIQPGVVIAAAAAAGVHAEYDSERQAVVMYMPDGKVVSFREAVQRGLISLSKAK
jgi:hypothetical protein